MAREGPLRLCVLECWSITAMSEENVVLEHLETPEKQGRSIKERGGGQPPFGALETLEQGFQWFQVRFNAFVQGSGSMLGI